MSCLSPLRAATVLVALTFLAQSTWAGAENDAGTGADAGDALDTATLLPDFGAFTGALSPRDADWFRVAREDATPSCVVADVGSTSNSAQAALVAEGSDGVRRVARAMVPEGGRAQLALASPGLRQTWLGLEPSENDPLRGDPARPGPYDARLSQDATLVEGGSVLGGDAGNSVSRALEAAPGCIEGRLQVATGFGDSRDVFAVDVPAGASVVYSYASAVPATLQLVDAAGAPVGPTVGSGEVGTASPTAGRYYLVASTAGVQDAAYAIGLIVGPDPNGCRPYCL